MRKFVSHLAVVFVFVFVTSCAFAGLQDDINRAAETIDAFQKIPESSIPTSVLKNCKGLAIITVGKAGFIISVRGGGGLVIANNADGWSAPSNVVLGGGGLGFQIGAEVTEFVLVLNTEKAVDTFAKGGSLTLGADIGVAAGPVGRNAEASVGTGSKGVIGVYSYSRAKGLFAGVSLQGTVLDEGKKTNAEFYGKPVTADQLLTGQIEPPASADNLYQALGKDIPHATPVAEPVATPAK